MFSLELIRNQKEWVKEKLKQRNFDIDKIDHIFELDKKNRELKTNLENLLSERNKFSKEIGFLISKKEEIKKINELQNLVSKINEKINLVENEQKKIQSEINNLISYIPNYCDDSVPIGKDESNNVYIKYWGKPKSFDFAPIPHWDLAPKLNILDLETASKITGSRYSLYLNDGAKLYRALQQFTLDNNIKNGFNEVLPSVVINSNSLFATGQLPKFKDDVYEFGGNNENFYLSPTAEVQLVNLYRNEIITNLPKRMTANTPCFRSEAGSAGKDTKGVLRLHQFYKSELVTICDEKDSWNEHEKITRTAEEVLEKLELPYRRTLLCTGDTGFCSAKTFDLEVWLPCYNEYKEISSCSNCLDFQARRANIRTKNLDNKNIFVHTLNGSSLAIDRLWVAIVENYQQSDGTILIPKALIPYMNGQTKIS